MLRETLATYNQYYDGKRLGFHDNRFNLLAGDDEVLLLLRFLSSRFIPVVRQTDRHRRICQLYHRYWQNDGVQLVEKTRLAGKPGL